MDGQGGSALRPLASVRDAVATLRHGSGDAEAARNAFLRIGAAVDAALRRMLRDHPDAPMETRLRALAADEMALDEVLASLRQRNALSIETAAGVHDLASARRRVSANGAPTAREAQLAIAVVERLEREAYPGHSARDPRPTGTPPERADPQRPAEAALPSRSTVARRESLVPVWIWGTAVIVILGIVMLGVLRSRAGGGPQLSEGIALFRTGDLDRAAVEFQRYVQARPNDVTGRLYLARVYRRLDRREEAAAELRRGLEIAPDDAALHSELGMLLLDAGQPDAAVGRFRTAVELDPQGIEGWLGLIRSLRESGQTAAANNIVARSPPEVRALVQRAP